MLFMGTKKYPDEAEYEVYGLIIVFHWNFHETSPYIDHVGLYPIMEGLQMLSLQMNTQITFLKFSRLFSSKRLIGIV